MREARRLYVVFVVGIHVVNGGILGRHGAPGHGEQNLEKEWEKMSPVQLGLYTTKESALN